MVEAEEEEEQAAEQEEAMGEEDKQSMTSEEEDLSVNLGWSALTGRPSHRQTGRDRQSAIKVCNKCMSVECQKSHEHPSHLPLSVFLSVSLSLSVHHI